MGGLLFPLPLPGPHLILLATSSACRDSTCISRGEWWGQPGGGSGVQAGLQEDGSNVFLMMLKFASDSLRRVWCLAFCRGP